MPRERILIVDDEPTVVRVCTEILTQHDYEVEGATSGKQGLALVEAESFDLIVVDIKMPDIDGLTVLRRAKELDPDLAAVVITGYAALDGAIEALHTGAQGFVLKPFGIDQFALAVREALAQRKKDQERMRLRVQLPILEIAQALMVEEDAPYTAKRILESIVREMHADQASLLLLGSIPGELYVAGALGLPDGVEGTRLLQGVDLVEQALVSDKPFVLESTDMLEPGLGQLLFGPEVGPAVVVPLRTVKRAVGVLSLGRSTDGSPFSQNELDLLFIIGGQVATAMENIRLFDAVARGKREWETTFDAITDGIFICDADLRIVRVNWALARWLGTKPAALIGRTCTELLYGAEVPAESHITLNAIHSGEPQVREVQLPKLSGVFALSVYPIVEDGEATRFVHVLKNVTERRRAEEQMHRRNRELLTLNAIATTISQTLDLDLILNDTLERALAVAEMEGGWVQLFDGEGGRPSLTVCLGVPQEMIEVVEAAQRDDGSIGQIIGSGESLVLSNTSLQVLLGVEDRGEEGMETIVGIPIKSKDEIYGVLVTFRRDSQMLEEQEVQLLTLIGHQIGVAVENVRLFEQLFTTHKRLRQLAQQIVSAQEEERRRVSRELHDEAGQALTALRISLQLMREDLADFDGLDQRIEEAIVLTETTMQRIRLLAQALRPPALEAVGLGPTLEDLCRDFAERTGLQIDFRAGELPAVPDDVSICLYRFLQEALTNVVKHAEAGRVEVALCYDSETLSLSVEDDGKGLTGDRSASGQPVGMGLLGMQERLELLSGWLEIVSQPDQGTRLVAFIPWEQAS